MLKNVQKTVTYWQCGNTKNYTISLITSFLLTEWQTWHVDWDDVQEKNTWKTQLISGLWLVAYREGGFGVFNPPPPEILKISVESSIT